MLEKVIDKAKRDPKVAEMLREIAELDAKLLPPTGIAFRAHEVKPPDPLELSKLSRLCREVAQRIVGPGEDADDMAEWLSYKCQQVVRELGENMRRSGGSGQKKAKARQDKRSNKAEELAQRYRIGDLIQSRYLVYDVITSGGFGVVYICYDREEGMALAIKGYKEEYALSDEDVGNFGREAYEWIQLENHQNIVRAGHVSVIGRRPFIFMEYVAGAEGIGSSLRGWIEHRRLDLEKALKMAAEIANGMQYAYEKRGLIHRDLKPDNVLVTGDGVAKVTDFGLAKVTESLKATALETGGKATPGVVSSTLSRGGGTAEYMAPEQFPEVILNYYNYPASSVTTRSDIFSFGLVLYEMLTGKHVFQAAPSLEGVIAQEAEAVCRQLFDQLCEEHNLDPNEHQELYDSLKYSIYCFRRLLKLDLPDPSENEDLNQLIFKCLETEPDNRYSSFKELRDELAQIYQEVSGKKIKLELTPPELEAGELILKGGSLDNLGRHEEALECFESAEEIPSGYIMPLWANKGITLAKLGRYEEALSYYDRAIEMDSGDAVVWLNKGDSLDRLGRHQEAISCFDRAIELDSRYADAWYNKGVSWGNLGKHEEALRCYDRAIELDPRHVSAYYNKGTLLDAPGRNKRDKEEALVCYNRAIFVDPRHAKAWGNKGCLLSDWGRHEEALECFERAVELEPRYANAWANKGMALSALKRHKEALGCYDKALEIEPGLELAQKGKLMCLAILYKGTPADIVTAEQGSDELARKGAALLRERRYEEAIVYFDKAIAMNSKLAVAWINKGASLAGLGRREEALECFEMALEIDPSDGWTWLLRGSLLEELDRDEEAVDSYNEAIERGQRDAGTWQDKGHSLSKLGRHEEALECFEMALEIDPRDANAWRNKGASLGRLRRYKDALACFEKALEINPSLEPARIGKLACLAELGKDSTADRETLEQGADELVRKGAASLGEMKYKEAIVYFDKAIAMNSKLAGAWMGKGASLSMLGKHEEALYCYDRAVEIDPGMAEAWHNKGFTLLKLRRHEEAIDCYERAIKINPGDVRFWVNKGASLVELGRHKEALSCYDKALEIDASSQQARVGMQVCLSQLAKEGNDAG